MPEAPVAIGKYQILEIVGEGAMGCVYRARDPVLNRDVAIKVMSDAIARDGSLRDRFMREAQAAGSLQHPNVVTIYDFGEYEGHLFIAMEFVQGIDLETLIEESIPMTIEQRLGIVIDVLVGLSYAHRHGVVHRDIKPANIRIDDEGHARIMDFGVAHLDSAKMTATGMMVGTPNYMAPEQVTGQKISPATDIFAIGAVLYELISGRKAFGADSLHNVLFKVVSEDPPPLSIIAPDAPPGLDPAVRRALAKEPEDRYPSAQEMANELTHIRARLAGAASETLSLGATIASRSREMAARPSSATAAVAKSRRTRNQVVAGTVLGAIILVGATWTYASRRDGPDLSVASTDTSVAAVPPSTPSAAPSREAEAATTSSGGDAPSAASGTPSPPPATRPRSTVSTSTAATSTAAPTTPTRPSPDPSIADSRDESEILGIVRRSAVAARARAVSAGATPTQLVEGDSLMASATRLSDARRYTEAVSALNAATTSWADAERLGSVAAQRRAQDSQAAVAAAPESSLRHASPPGNSAGANPPSPVPPATKKVEAPAPSPTVQLSALVGEYAQAITARDLPGIRAIYPSISAEQQRGFQSFFDAVTNLRATLTAASPAVQGDSATAQITGTYDFVDSNGKPQHQAVSFRAVFRRDGGRWYIVSVR